MKLHGIKSEHDGDSETSLYDNTGITSATEGKPDTSHSGHTGIEDGPHKQLKTLRKTNGRMPSAGDETPKRIKPLIYITLALVIALYMIAIVLVIVAVVHKENGGDWPKWGSSRFCKMSCEGEIKSSNHSCSKTTTLPFECTSEHIDGGWSNWGTWSMCSDSCGGGIKSRNRSCSNPAPSMHGKQCLGNSEHVSQCNKHLCPGTDGSWSNWGTWSTCSDSCGGGIKSRDRSCSNPAPSMLGKQCLGNSEHVIQCNKHLCPGTDGGWSNWGTWSTCSDSCGGGIKSRKRSCLNPEPSMLGKQCLGNSEQVNQCNKQLCPGTDGGWSVWGNWGSCTVSCGGGVRTRSRSCTNPTPSMTGRPCIGDSTDVNACNRTKCLEHNVAFTAYNIYQNSSNFTALLFQKTHINIGDGYDTTTGKFTCNIPGVYHFIVTLTKVYQDINTVYAYLRINGNSQFYLYFQPKLDDSNEVGTQMMTGAGTFHLDQNDVVDVFGIPDYFLYSLYSYFTGFLITPDQ